MNVNLVEDEGWFLEAKHLNTDTDTFGDLKSLGDLWHARRIGGALPTWKDFELQDFQNWYGWLCVFDIVEGDPLALKVRLWGTHITGMMGEDITGTMVAPTATSSQFEHGGYTLKEIEFYDHLRNGPFIGYSGGRLKLENRDHIRYTELHLPLARDGKTVDQFLTITSRKPL